MIWLIIVIIICTVVIVSSYNNKTKNEQLMAGNIAASKYIKLKYEWLSFLSDEEYRKRGEIIQLLKESKLSDKQKWEKVQDISKKYAEEHEIERRKMTKESSDALTEANARGIHPENEEIERESYSKEDWWKEEQAEYNKLINPLIIKFEPELAKSMRISAKDK